MTTAMDATVPTSNAGKLHLSPVNPKLHLQAASLDPSLFTTRHTPREQWLASHVHNRAESAAFPTVVKPVGHLVQLVAPEKYPTGHGRQTSVDQLAEKCPFLHVSLVVEMYSFVKSGTSNKC